jgi:hypothetical protein
MFPRFHGDGGIHRDKLLEIAILDYLINQRLLKSAKAFVDESKLSTDWAWKAADIPGSFCNLEY